MRFAFRRNTGSLYVPPSEDAPRRARTCEAGHTYSVAVDECPHCRLAREKVAEADEIRRVLAPPRKCGCGCGAHIHPGANGQRKYLNPTHAKRQFDRGLRAAEKRVREATR